MSHSSKLAPDSPPSISRVDFYRLDGGDFLALLAEGVRRAGEQGLHYSNPADHAALSALVSMLVDVPNGGFTQFSYNRRGDVGIEHAAELLDRLGAVKAATIVRDALAVYRRHRAAFAVSNPFDSLFGSIAEFGRVDRAFYRVMHQAARTVRGWAREHAAAMFVLRRWHTKRCGSLPQWRNGKAAAELWLNGQVRKRESRRGAHRIIDCYYASGAMRKRFVGDKAYHAVEPVRLFHESGRLAEEEHLQGSLHLGPWLRFFDDGAPRLVAEWRPGGDLVVREAWTDDHRHVVRNGTGTFHDEGRRIAPFYDLYFESPWPRTIELRDGRPHGKETTWHAGAVWIVRPFDNGVLHGEATMYWDNGRVRSVTQHFHGVEGATRHFPKFDAPRPAVLLGTLADEGLYAAWKHRRLDEYPRPLNVREVEALTVPDMLREVHARNLAGALKSEYEDLHTFNDGIAYRVRIDEAGCVVSARATGSGIYSVALIGTHVEILRKLRFSPGGFAGRPSRARCA